MMRRALDAEPVESVETVDATDGGATLTWQSYQQLEKDPQSDRL
jgi:hypothetical protein